MLRMCPADGLEWRLAAYDAINQNPAAEQLRGVVDEFGRRLDKLMPRFTILALSLFISTAAVADRLQKCPVASSDQKAVADAVTSAPSCAQAYEVMNVCRSNAGGDVTLANIVVQTCEKVFMATIDPAAAKSYQSARDSCARRFAHQDGTQSASFQATCEAGVAVVFAHRADLAAMRGRRAPFGTLTAPK